jgi:hypothetical protein
MGDNEGDNPPKPCYNVRVKNYGGKRKMDVWDGLNAFLKKQYPKVLFTLTTGEVR